MLTSSLKRKIVVTCGAMLGFCLLYETTAFDSRQAARDAEVREDTTLPSPGRQLRFAATAYCRGVTTASGAAVRKGVAAADPTLLPVGSVIRVDSLGPTYNGIYTVMDTGPAVQGRQVDIYMWNCDEAVRFGRRSIGLQVLRLGWNPLASGRQADAGFSSRERTRSADAVRARLTSSPPPPRSH